MSSLPPKPESSLDATVDNAKRLIADLNNTLAGFTIESPRGPGVDLAEMQMLLESANRRLTAQTTQERASRLEARSLSRALEEMTDERDRLSRERKRSLAAMAELQAQNEQLADAAVNTQMQVIRLRAKLAEAADRLAAEQAATEYARDRGARLQGELLEERRRRRSQAAVAQTQLGEARAS